MSGPCLFWFMCIKIRCFDNFAYHLENQYNPESSFTEYTNIVVLSMPYPVLDLKIDFKNDQNKWNKVFSKINFVFYLTAYILKTVLSWSRTHICNPSPREMR